MELFIVNEYVDFTDQSLIGKSPIKSKISYIRELSFMFDQSTTNHFELTHNLVKTKDERYLFNSEKTYEYLDFSEKYTY